MVLVVAGVIILFTAIRLVGGLSHGVPGLLKDYPYYGFIKSDAFPQPHRPLCAATLITKKHILSLDACLIHHKENELKVQFGVFNWCKNLSLPFSHETKITDVNFEPAHEDYRSRLAIGVLENEPPATITPIEVTSWKGIFKRDSESFFLPGYGGLKKSIKNSKSSFLPGYGGIKDGIPHKLHCNFLILNLTHIEALYGRIALYEPCRKPGIFCSLIQTEAIAYTDEGGPLIISKTGKHELVGVTAFTGPDYVVMFRDVLSVIDWISNMTGIVKPQIKPEIIIPKVKENFEAHSVPKKIKPKDNPRGKFNQVSKNSQKKAKAKSRKAVEVKPAHQPKGNVGKSGKFNKIKLPGKRTVKPTGDQKLMAIPKPKPKPKQ